MIELPVDEFSQAYFEAALFFSRDTDTEAEFLGELHDIEDFDIPTHNLFVLDCQKFQQDYGHLIIKDNLRNHSTTPLQRAGHDFWLTRNHHGSGFWDGDWKKPAADTLTKAAHSFGEVHIFEGNFRCLTCNKSPPQKRIIYGG